MRCGQMVAVPWFIPQALQWVELFPFKVMSSWNLRMWPYMEMGSLQIQSR